MSPTNLIAASFCISGIFLYAIAAFLYIRARAERQKPRTVSKRVDVWEMQRRMMEKSGQRIPVTPRLHNGTVLYAALNIEELGEMCESMSNTLAHYPCVTQRGVPLLAERFLVLSRTMRATALEIRGALKKINIGNHQLTPTDAKALFDDTTDLMVTNAGFALSCGFPGAAGYCEVQDSNLSKANPATGIIDKTEDGKWIKGPNYYEADLIRVLTHDSPLWAARIGIDGPAQ